jgi:hypothetical protein
MSAGESFRFFSGLISSLHVTFPALQGDATTGQAGAANNVAGWVGEAPPTAVPYQTTVSENDSEPAFD